MNRIFCILLIIVSLSGCQNESRRGKSRELEEIINIYQGHEGFDSKKYPLGLHTKAYFESEANFAENLLNDLSKIDTVGFIETDKISHGLLVFLLRQKVDYFRFDRYLTPFISNTGFHNSLPYNVKPLMNHKQVVDYLAILNAIPEYINQHIVNSREGLKKGMGQPKAVFGGYSSTYDDQIVDNYEDSFYYSPFKNLPDNLSKFQKDSVLRAAKTAIETKVIPSFKKVKEFFDKEYIPNARMTLGLSETPNGKAKYQNLINFYTTSTAYTPEDIHRIGLKEVARIKTEMEDIIKNLGFKGDFHSFLHFLRTDKQFYAKSGEELLMRARDIAKRADAQLPKFFKILSRKPYGVAPVPKAIAPKYTGGRYIPTGKESTEPGYYWVNTYDLLSRPLYTLPALTAHEAVPGHHLQISLNREMGDSIPEFRREFSVVAFVEGWGLYSETLGGEMGLYNTPYEQFGKLTYEMWRACRLVVDTGIHAKGWGRQMAIDYMANNTALSMLEITSEIDRYISNPGQAVAYKIGELKILELREKSRQKLGLKFDIRTFHKVLLEQGNVTLPILEQRINKYINEYKG